MKRCPTCNREFDDDTLSMCVDDGSPLIRDIPGTPKPEFPATQGYTGLGGKATWSASQDDIPALQQYLATTAGPRKRWPWLIAIVGALLVIVALTVVFVLIKR
jgi:hypothetical protein